jgi:hypothetical protein
MPARNPGIEVTGEPKLVDLNQWLVVFYPHG